MTTNILLTLIVVLLLVRIALQVWQGKETLKRAYATVSEVENVCDVCFGGAEVERILKSRGKDGYEFTGAMSRGVGVYLFFTRKKIKNYMEE